MPDETIDRDLPLKEDTRLPGRLLGDVLRTRTVAVANPALDMRRLGADLEEKQEPRVASLAGAQKGNGMK